MIQVDWPAQQRVITRKQRLYCCACVRRVWYRLGDEAAGRRAVEIAEEFADLQRSRHELAEARDAAIAECDARSGCPPGERRQVWEAVRAAALCASEEHSGSCYTTDVVGGHAVRASRESEEAERATQRARHLDIFGDPDRPVAFDPAWRTATALLLAERMYRTRDFGAMPILADALQDAGCDSAAILSHCRGPGPRHVRGCWVIDLVLGKE